MNRPENQSQYWSSRPRLRCRAASSRCSAAGLLAAVRPSTALAALPGSTSVAANTSTDTTHKVNSPAAARRPRSRRTG